MPALTDLLSDPTFNHRLQAAHALGKIGPEAKAAIPALVDTLYDPTTSVAVAAAMALSQMRPEAVPAVLATWSQEESFHRPFVIQALGLLGPAAKAATPRLIEALANTYPVIQKAAEESLLLIGTEAVPYLAKALNEGDPAVRPLIAEILGRMGPAASEAVPALTRALQDSNLRVRLQAAQALWQINHSAERIVSTLVEGLKDPNLSLRGLSATVLGQMARVPESAIPALQAALKEPNPNIRFSAAVSLSRLPGHAKEAIPVLMATLKINVLRPQAVEALGEVGPEAKEAVPALLSALQDGRTNYPTAARIGWALERIAGPESIDSLGRALAGAGKKTRPWIAQALALTGPAGAASLAKLSDDDDPNVRMVVVQAAGRSAAGLPTLVKALGDKDGRVRQGAILAVGHLGTAASAAIPALSELLKHADSSERLLALEALGYVEPRSPAAISTLVEMLGERNLGLWEQAAAVLGRLGPNAQAAVPALAEAVCSMNEALRMEAALALASMGTDNPEVFPVLLEIFQDRNHPLRARALEAMAQLAAKRGSVPSRGEVQSPSTLPAVLATRLLWDDEKVRAKAAEVLGRMGPAARSAIPALMDVLKGSDNQARIQAALAVWQIDHRTEEVVPVLVGELKSSFVPPPQGTLTLPGRFGVAGSPPAPLCQQAAEALGQMGPAARCGAGTP